MSNFLCITVRFLQPLSHGRGDGGEPEWPPSPLRLFQALVAASAARWNERLRLEYAVPALEWLAKQSAPTVVAAVGVKSDVTYRLYVPDNVGDRVAKSWRGGNASASIAGYRTEKDVRPTHLAGDAVHFLYPIPEGDGGFADHRQTLIDAARGVTHLGWGVDMVVGNAAALTQKEATELAGERWAPAPNRAGVQLRVPRADTLRALMDKHSAFLNRLSDGGFRPVPPLTAFEVVGYTREGDPVERPFAAFELRTPEFDRFQPYDPVRRTPDVAGMVRHVVEELARQTRPLGWSDEQINTFVHGHTADGTDRARGAGADARFSYLPLPSLERRGGRCVHFGAIRRVLLAAPPEHGAAVLWARVLSGHVLSPLGDTRPAALRLIDRPAASLRTEPNLGPYVGESRAWSTVTPVVLPGHDDPDGIRRRLRERDPTKALSDGPRVNQLAELARRSRALLVRAFEHAGFPRSVIDGAELEWRDVGFRAGVELASRYRVPERLTGPRYHVRVVFPRSVRGPLAVGAGRYRGLGLFATETDGPISG